MFKLTKRSVLAVVLTLGTVVAVEAADPSSVALIDGSGLSWQQAREVIQQYGGRVDIILVPNVLIGDIPDGAAAALAARTSPQARIANAPSTIRIARTR